MLQLITAPVKVICRVSHFIFFLTGILGLPLEGQGTSVGQ